MKNFKLRKRYIIILSIVLVLVIVRLILPYFIVKYVNKAMANNIAPYKGSISDVDLSLLSGSYRICDMKIDLVDEHGEKPFFHAPNIDLSVEWAALLKGGFVGEIDIEQPLVNFKFSKKGNQTGEEVKWVQLAKDLMPIQINRLYIDNGKVNFSYSDGAAPDYNMDFERFYLEVNNMRNVEDETNPLPSPIVATADSPGYGGKFVFTADAMFLKEIPDFNYDARFENAQLTAFNETFKHFTGMDFEAGSVSLYSEMAMKDGKYVGYFKPLLKNAKIFKLKEKDRTFFQGVKELFSEGVQEVFENQSIKQTAARIPIEGTVGKSAVNVWETIVSSFMNAYIKAFQFQLDDSIDFSSVAAKHQEKNIKKGDSDKKDDGKKKDKK